MPATLESDTDILSLLPPGRIEFVPNEPMSEGEFFDLCQRADSLRLECTSNGKIIVMPPAGSYSSNRSGEIFGQLRNWTRSKEQGAAFDSSGGFTLPNGAIRAPGAAWVSSERLTSLSQEEKERFLPLAPDFAVEVRSQNDRPTDLKGKMREYVENGTRRAWLVDSYQKTVTVYQEDGSVQEYETPDTLSGDPVLPGFTCNLERVWDPTY